MKRIILVSAILATIVTGCQMEPMTEQVSSDIVTAFEASTEVFSPPTKTSMTSDKKIVWSADDEIAIFQGSTLADRYVVSESSVGQSNAIFDMVHDNSPVNGSFSAGTELPCNVALYPYAEGLTLSGSVMEEETVYSVSGVVIPADQTYSEGSFANGSFMMVAVTDNLADHNLRFKNVLGAMKLQLKGTQAVKSIKITGRNNEILSGPATVMAYTDGLKPAITMTGTDAADKAVTLVCTDGVQLNESTATDFIIALPPVLFTKGFTVTVTDSEDETYTIETSTANTVLRSSILAMPVVTLGQEPENGNDSDETYIEYVFLNKSSLTMMPNTSYTLVADIDPADVTYPTLAWSSSDNSVAEVDQNGKVTAKSDGHATITALAVGGKSASCSVTVRTPKEFAAGDYIDYVDALGVNHGKGVAVAGVIWAPVNCGYEPADGDYKGYPYGKLYQWGRKYGQGYDSSDATYPSGDNLVEGPVAPSWGSSETYKDVFFYGSSDWCNNRIDDLWADSDSNKTAKDPCPTGWRVPTYGELDALSENYSSWTTNSAGQNGYYFVGEYTYMDGLPQVFFPAAGCLVRGGGANHRDYNGHYWSSDAFGTLAYYLYFASGDVSMNYSIYHGRALGSSVRCVQE